MDNNNYLHKDSNGGADIMMSPTTNIQLLNHALLHNIQLIVVTVAAALAYKQWNFGVPNNGSLTPILSRIYTLAIRYTCIIKSYLSSGVSRSS